MSGRNCNCRAEKASYLRQVRLIAMAVVCLGATACLSDPGHAELGQIFDQLTSTRSMLAESPPRVSDGCTLLGTASTRLYGEPGLADIQPAWTELQNTAYALQAVCGQSMLLAQPSTGSTFIVAARARWQQGIEREMGVACDHLRSAAAALNRASAC